MASYYNENKFQTLSVAYRVHDLGPADHNIVCYPVLLTAALALPPSLPNTKFVPAQDWMTGSIQINVNFSETPSLNSL